MKRHKMLKKVFINATKINFSLFVSFVIFMHFRGN